MNKTDIYSTLAEIVKDKNLASRAWVKASIAPIHTIAKEVREQGALQGLINEITELRISALEDQLKSKDLAEAVELLQDCVKLIEGVTAFHSIEPNRYTLYKDIQNFLKKERD